MKWIKGTNLGASRPYLEYVAFTGQPSVKTIYNWRTRKYEEVLAIDVGRPDRVPPTDSDRLLNPEWGRYFRSHNARSGEHTSVSLEVANYIQAHGPSRMTHISDGIGRTNRPVIYVLKRKDFFFQDDDGFWHYREETD